MSYFIPCFLLFSRFSIWFTICIQIADGSITAEICDHVMWTWMWGKSLNSLKEVTENLRRQNRENMEEASSQMKPSNVGPEWETGRSEKQQLHAVRKFSECSFQWPVFEHVSLIMMHHSWQQCIWSQLQHMLKSIIAYFSDPKHCSERAGHGCRFQLH